MAFQIAVFDTNIINPSGKKRRSAEKLQNGSPPFLFDRNKITGTLHKNISDRWIILNFNYICIIKLCSYNYIYNKFY
ncbi:MAG TPA: hypothetical protein DCX97_04385 [Alistipes sp.]|nr:hypothetical protein [Alistipes sp.]